MAEVAEPGHSSCDPAEAVEAAEAAAEVAAAAQGSTVRHCSSWAFVEDCESSIPVPGCAIPATAAGGAILRRAGPM